MELITSDHLWKIQRFTAMVALGLSSIAIFINLIAINSLNQKIFNISAIAAIMIPLVVSLVINKEIMRLMQLLIFIMVGILTILFDTKNNYIGDILFITGILLAYTYRLISTYSYKTIVAIIISILCLRLMTGLIIKGGNVAEEVITSAVSVTLILFLITLLKNELIWYIKESQKNDVYTRAGMNIAGYAHSLDLGTAISTARIIRRKLEKQEPGSALRFVKNLEQMLVMKNQVKEAILYSAGQSRKTTRQTVDLHRLLKSVVKLACFDMQSFTRIQFTTHFAKDEFLIRAVPFEINFILQNLISNAAEAMLRTDRQHRLTISTEKAGNTGRVIITDTGPGFDLACNRQEPQLQRLKSSKGDAGGFGLLYTMLLIRQNNIDAEFKNCQSGGARVILNLHLQGDKDV